jgi:hypothetical protein
MTTDSMIKKPAKATLFYDQVVEEIGLRIKILGDQTRNALK